MLLLSTSLFENDFNVSKGIINPILNSCFHWSDEGKGALFILGRADINMIADNEWSLRLSDAVFIVLSLAKSII